MFHPGRHVWLDLLPSGLALVLNVEEEVDEGICVIHPAQIEDNARVVVGQSSASLDQRRN
jgi:hypothetical protein